MAHLQRSWAGVQRCSYYTRQRSSTWHFMWFPPVVNLVRHAGDSSQVHSSGMRSFDLQCAVYNFDKLASTPQSKSKEFIIRCFFDTGKRWDSFQAPRACTLIHIV